MKRIILEFSDIPEEAVGIVLKTLSDITEGITEIDPLINVEDQDLDELREKATEVFQMLMEGRTTDAINAIVKMDAPIWRTEPLPDNEEDAHGNAWQPPLPEEF